MGSRIYLDHVASTPLDPTVAEAMERARGAAVGNPSSLHLEGRRAKDLLEGARERVSRVLGSRPREIVFTGGGTEACDLGLRGAALARSALGRRIVTTGIEHAAVSDAADALASGGFEVVRVAPAADGTVSAEAVAAACGAGTTVASVMLANHETGVVLPVRAVADAIRPRGVLLHCDACVGPGLLDVSVEALGVDVLALSAHKWNGPKGIGVLYVRRKTKLERVRRGGVQEERLRPGTEDVVGAVGLATALERAEAARGERKTRHAALGARLEAGLCAVEGCAVVGAPRGRLPGIVNIEVPGCEGESLLINLDLEGVAVSTGSACAVGATDPSPVLLAMGFSARRAASTIRFSVGEGVTENDIDRACEIFAAIVARLRALSR